VRRGPNESKIGFQPKRNFLKNEICRLRVNAHSNLKRRKHHFHHLLEVHRVNEVEQT